MNLWKEYKSALSETISLYPESVWANWESKGMHLFAKTFAHPNLISQEKLKYGTISVVFTTTYYIQKRGVTFPVLVWT